MKKILGLTLFVISMINAAATVPPDMLGAEWTLTSLNGVGRGEDRPPTVSFTREKMPWGGGAKLIGFSGCNRYSGIYALLPGRAITIRLRGMTKMACEGPRMELERDFAAALDAAAFYEWRNDMTLMLTSKDGRKQLSFKRLPAKPK